MSEERFTKKPQDCPECKGTDVRETPSAFWCAGCNWTGRRTPRTTGSGAVAERRNY